jgi:hypothetical protein
MYNTDEYSTNLKKLYFQSPYLRWLEGRNLERDRQKNQNLGQEHQTHAEEDRDRGKPESLWKVTSDCINHSSS